RAGRSLQLDERTEVEDVERDRNAVGHPPGAPLWVRPADAEPELLEHVEGGVDVLDLDLGLLARFHPSVERRRSFRSEHAVRAAVEDAKAEGRVACRLAGTGEAVVLLAVARAPVRAALAQHPAQVDVVLRSGEAEFELRLDGAVALRPCHARRLAASASFRAERTASSPGP